MAAGHGLVLGKFLPPHAGHHELVDFALGCCSRVTVLVLGSVTEPIPLSLRRDWIAPTGLARVEVRPRDLSGEGP